jgi:hypothetical protein
LPPKKKYCAWCGCVTNARIGFVPSTPVLEWLEEKIDTLGRDKVWDENSDWSKVKMDSQTEAELLVYEELMNTVVKQVVCDKCLDEDHKLFAKYYGEDQDDIFFDDDF